VFFEADLLLRIEVESVLQLLTDLQLNMENYKFAEWSLNILNYVAKIKG
jgi:hypothetical protein